MHALDGVRILDLTGGIAGPLGVLQLAEHGADVIKVEPPGGHPDRSQPSSTVYNRSRRSVTLDYTSEEGAALFMELCATADVVVESFPQQTLEPFGIGHAEVRERYPRLIWCSLPAWPTGTRMEGLPADEALVQARTGQQWEITSFRTGPVFLHSPVASYGAMFLVPIGIAAALVSRNRTGVGQHLEISLFQGAMSLTTQVWNWTDKGQHLLAKSHPPGIHQGSIYECAGGEWIHAATMSGVPPKRSEAAILGMEEIPIQELFAMTSEQRADYETRKREAYRSKDRAALIEEFHEAGLGAEAIVAPHEKYAHPQLVATASVVEVQDPDIGRTTQLGPTVFLESTPGEVRGPQPRPGAHTDEVLRQLGRTDDEIAGLRQRAVI